MAQHLAALREVAGRLAPERLEAHRERGGIPPEFPLREYTAAGVDLTAREAIASAQALIDYANDLNAREHAVRAVARRERTGAKASARATNKILARFNRHAAALGIDGLELLPVDPLEGLGDCLRDSEHADVGDLYAALEQSLDAARTSLVELEADLLEAEAEELEEVDEGEVLE